MKLIKNYWILLSIMCVSVSISCSNPSSNGAKRDLRTAKETVSNVSVDGQVITEGIRSLEEGKIPQNNSDMLQLAQSLFDKQPTAGAGICSEGACLTNTNLCESLNIASRQYYLSADGSKCMLDEKSSCKAWEKKGTDKWPVWDSDKKKWIPFEIEICVSDRAKCTDPDFSKKGTWYKWVTVSRQYTKFVADDGSIIGASESPDIPPVGQQIENPAYGICVQQDLYCSDHYGKLSVSTPQEDVLIAATGRSQNECSITPKFCRSKNMYLNTQSSGAKENSDDLTDLDTRLSNLVWESECVPEDKFVSAGPLVCKAHDMEFEENTGTCFNNTEESCQDSGRIWVSDQLYPKFSELLKNYQFIHKKLSTGTQGPESDLSYEGFTKIDYKLPNYQQLGIPEEDARYTGFYPVIPNKRCQMANIETCRMIGKLYDPGERKCVDSISRNLMVVLRTLEIDNSYGCIDRWTEKSGPSTGEIVQDVFATILTKGIYAAAGGLHTGTTKEFEAPFEYEVKDFRILTSDGVTGEVVKATKVFKIPQKKEYNFLESAVVPVEIKGSNFCFDVKFDVFVSGRKLQEEKLLLGSVLKTFCYTDTHFPYSYYTLLPFKNKNSHEFNKAGFISLYDELRNELSYSHITSAFRTTAGKDIPDLEDWFVTGIQDSVLSGSENESPLTRTDGKKWVDNSLYDSIRLSYKLIRNNWSDRLNKQSEILSFNPDMVNTRSSDSDTREDGRKVYNYIDPSLCYGRLIWSWQWFPGE
ncbi:MAG: hypothetical protein H6618_07435 [Deltaproteobacteria bacterium]|nr:hypothetical protein [Deltaproteobacteria bacterium]